jgi:hypothetical protein
MNPLDIFIAYVSWGNAGKSRPVLVFREDGNRVDVFAITTQYKGKSKTIQAKYFKIDDWQQAGLDKQRFFKFISN